MLHVIQLGDQYNTAAALPHWPEQTPRLCRLELHGMPPGVVDRPQTVAAVAKCGLRQSDLLALHNWDHSGKSCRPLGRPL